MDFLVIRGHAICLREPGSEGLRHTRPLHTIEGQALDKKPAAKKIEHQPKKPKDKPVVKSLTDDRYSLSVQKVRDRAQALARGLGHADVSCEHLVLAIAIEPEGRKTLVKFDFDADLTRKAAVKCISAKTQEAHLAEGTIGRCEQFEKIMSAAMNRAGEREPEFRAASLDDVIYDILSVPDAVPARDLIKGRGLEPDDNTLTAEVRNSRKATDTALDEVRKLQGRVAEMATTLSLVSNAILEPRQPIRPNSTWFGASAPAPARPAYAMAFHANAANDNPSSSRAFAAKVAVGVLLLSIGALAGYLLRDGGIGLGKLGGWLTYIAV